MNQEFLDFVKYWHKDQVRKYTGEPYWYHLVEVAEILESVGLGKLQLIALGHDLLEDTDCTEDDIRSALDFDYQTKIWVINGIKQLTDVYTSKDYPDINRKQRKWMECNRLKGISVDCQNVKYADLISNTRSIAQHDPNFAKVYLNEKRDILIHLNKGDKDLLEMAWGELINAKTIKPHENNQRLNP